jgi:CRISPR-associated endonuclease/helicase Cas3
MNRHARVQGAIARRVPSDRAAPTLDAHVTAVATQAKEFADTLQNRDLSSLAYLAGLWHDLGKYHPEWQAYIQSLTGLSRDERKKVRSVQHSTVGAIHANEQFKVAYRENRIDYRGAVALAYLIAGHHSGLANFSEPADSPTVKSTLQARMSDPGQVQRHREAVLLAPASVATPPGEFPALPGRLGDPQLLIRMLFSCLIDADRLVSEKETDPAAATRRSQYEPLENLRAHLLRFRKKLTGRKRRPRTPLQAILYQERENLWQDCIAKSALPPGVFTLTGGTGLGKTLSGSGFMIEHAIRHGKRRIIYVAPFISITDQIARVLRVAFGTRNVLEHHSSVRDPRDTEEAQEIAAAAALARENWDAPVIVTTYAQLFESLFAARPTRCRKLHNIANSVIFIDEAQAMPVELLRPLVAVLNELVANYGVTIVLSTATQPSLKPKPWEGFVGITGSTEIARNPTSVIQRTKRATTTIYPLGRNQGLEWDEVATELLKRRTALCIVNTKGGAADLFAKMPRGQHSNRTAFHLSSYMCVRHRADVLKDVQRKLANRRRKSPLWLISTPLIEAGVDIDFPCVFRAVGPLDSMVQAAGRCNREAALPGLGDFVVFPSREPWVPGLIADRGIGGHFLATTPNPDDLYLPSTFEAYFDRLYADKYLDRNKITQMITKFPPNFRDIERAFRLIPDDQITVIVPYGQDGVDAINAFKAAEAGHPVPGLFEMIQGLTISIFRKNAEPLIAAGILGHLPKFDVYYLADPSRYDPDLGFDDTAPSEDDRSQTSKENTP